MQSRERSFYSRVIAPRLISGLCGIGPITEQRQRIVPRATGRVLEIGIGSGRNLPFYDPVKVSKVIGVDPDVTMLELGHARFQSSPVPLDIIEGTAEALPLDNETVDTALIAYTLCSLPNPDAALDEIRRVLRPGGEILFCEHGRSELKRVAKAQDAVNPVWRQIAGGCNLNRDVEELMKFAGFEIVELERFSLARLPKTIGSHFIGCARLIVS